MHDLRGRIEKNIKYSYFNNFSYGTFHQVLSLTRDKETKKKITKIMPISQLVFLHISALLEPQLTLINSTEILTK